MTRRELLVVRHGSRLYGTAHAGSDEDFYVVTETAPPGGRYGRSSQSQANGRDTVVKDLGQWVRELQDGVPQALEAAWAGPEFTETDLLGNFRRSLVAGTAAVPRHQRAMRNFASAYWSGGGSGRPDEYAMKRARHAVRLARSIRLLRRDGRYNPTMTEDEAEACRRTAANLGPGDELYETCRAVAWGRTGT